jgi:hypothetical protein
MSSVIAYPGFLFASTICDLADADVSPLNEGCLAFVESKKNFYRLSQDPVPPAPNGTTVLSVPGGPSTPGCTSGVPGTDPRRWVLTNLADRSPSLFPGTIFWKPSAAADDPKYVRTWAEVMNALSQTAVPTDIYVESVASDAIVPPGTYDLHDSRFASKLGDPNSNTVVISDGAIFLNAGGTYGAVSLQLHPTALGTPGGTFQYSYNPIGVFASWTGSQIVNLGSVAAFQVPDNQTFVFAGVDGGNILPGAHALISLGNNAGLLATAFTAGGGFPAGYCESTFATSRIVYQTDGSADDPATGLLPALPFFAGSVLYGATGNAFKGPTALRPTAILGAVPIGLCFFDTSLGAKGKPIWYVGNPPSATGWVDATGADA